MREVVDRARVEQVMVALADAADRDVDVYFTGGASAVLIGWRPSTVDIDFVAVPDSGAMMRAVPAIKERLAVNVEYASPAHFIPVPDGWPDRSTFIAQIGRVRAWPRRSVAGRARICRACPTTAIGTRCSMERYS
jgi:hypothetical protein